MPDFHKKVCKRVNEVRFYMKMCIKLFYVRFPLKNCKKNDLSQFSINKI